MTAGDQAQVLGLMHTLYGDAWVEKHAAAPGPVRRFLLRQLYGLAGKVPGGTSAAEAAGAGVNAARKELSKAVSRGASASEIKRLRMVVRAAEKGYDHLLGVARGLVKSPGDVVRTGWGALGPGGRLMAVSVPPLSFALHKLYPTANEEDSNSIVAGDLAQSAAMVAGGGLPLVPGLALDVAGSHLGKALGKMRSD